MSFANRLTLIRKQQRLLQSELAAKVGLHTNALGRYERGDAVPSVEIAAKIASELGTSLDYLIGLSELSIDNDLLQRLKQITGLSDENKKQLYAVVDALLRDYKAKKLKSPACDAGLNKFIKAQVAECVSDLHTLAKMDLIR